VLGTLNIMHEIPMSSIALSETEKPKNRHTPLAIGTLAAILTPGAYLLGLSYYQGYMSAFGVESDGFPISAPDVYVFSYQTIGYFLLTVGEISVKALNELFKPPVVFWAVGILMGLVSGIYWLLRSTRVGFHPRIQRALTKVKAVASWFHWRNNDFTKSMGIVGVASYGVFLIVTSAAAIALFWWLLPLGAYSKGHDVAYERIRLYLEKGCHADAKTKWDTCFLMIDDKGDAIHEGLLIAVNDKEIAIFKKDGSYVFARQEGSLLRRKLH
jgi:hypothetical protein